MKYSKGAAALVGLALVAVGACGGSSTSKEGGAAEAGQPVTITMWHAQVDSAEKQMALIAEKFHAKFPNITVQLEQGATGDEMLGKLSTVLTTDKAPDIAYVFGTDTPNLARSDKVVDLTAAVKDPTWGWDDFYEGERAVGTVNGKVVGIPAVVDNLAVVYNKAIFTAAGIPEPSPDWSWDEYRQTALALTNNGKIGTAYPSAGDEDTVWRFWPMVWQQGGKTISDDGKSSTFTDPQFSTALSLLRTMAVDDQSMYLDTPDGVLGAFQAGQIGMIITGPWALYDIAQAKVEFGVVQLPGFNGDHQTVSGPDNWMVFDNGAARVAAATEFLKYLSSVEGDTMWSVQMGSMPIRNGSQKTPDWDKALAENAGFKEFFANFANSKQSRPQTSVYPEYSKALGDAIVSVLTGNAEVDAALSTAKAAADKALAGG